MKTAIKIIALAFTTAFALIAIASYLLI